MIERARYRLRLFVVTAIYGVAALVVAAVVLPGSCEGLRHDAAADLNADFPPAAAAQYDYLVRHLEEDFQGYERWQTWAPEYAVVMLSQIACGIMNLYTAEALKPDEAQHAIGLIVERAMSPKLSPYAKPLLEVDDLGEHGLYLGHTNLILGIYRHVTQETRYDTLHTHLSLHLRKLSVRRGAAGFARSFPVPKRKDDPEPDKARHRWPADQAVVLNSLFLYDKTRDKDFSSKLIKLYLKTMSARLTDEETGLHHAALSKEDDKFAGMPRGGAMAVTLFHMSQFAPREADKLYPKFREHFGHWLAGWGGFREWPAIKRGTDRMDDRSGLVVGGLGMSATALGLASARLYRDLPHYHGARRTLVSLAKPSPYMPRRYQTSPLIGDAILFNGLTARRWFGKQPDTAGYDDRIPTPIALYILMCLETLLISVLLSHAYQRFKHLFAGRRF